MIIFQSQITVAILKVEDSPAKDFEFTTFVNHLHDTEPCLMYSGRVFPCSVETIEAERERTEQ